MTDYPCQFINLITIARYKKHNIYFFDLEGVMVFFFLIRPTARTTLHCQCKACLSEAVSIIVKQIWGSQWENSYLILVKIIQVRHVFILHAHAYRFM